MKISRVIGMALALACSGLAYAQGDIGPLVTPEPSTAVMLAAGVAGLGYLAWRRNRRK